MKPRRVYRPRTTGQEFKRLMEELDLDILKAYAKAGSLAAQEELERVMREKNK